MTELGLHNNEPMDICGDNMGSLFIAQNPAVEKRSKHIDIIFHFIRQVIDEKKVQLYFIPGTENPADLLTKNLGCVKFEYFRDNYYGLEFSNPTYSAAKRSNNMAPPT